MKKPCKVPGCQFPAAPKRQGRCTGHADEHKLELTRLRMRRYRKRLTKAESK